MPFSKTSTHSEEYWTNHFENFLKPFLEHRFPKLIVRKSEPLRGDVLNQIILDLIKSRIVIADITDFNPNVVWELGVRQSFKHGTITIAEEGTDLPFDLNRKGTLFYKFSSHPFGKMPDQFVDQLAKAIQDCLHKPKRPDSPILESISGHGTFYQTVLKDDILRKLDSLLDECYANIGLLNAILETARKNEPIVQEIVRIRGDEKVIEKNNKLYELENKLVWTTSRLRSSSIEHLVTTRYLDKDNEFYSSSSDYFHDMLRINDQLISWEYHYNSINNYLIFHIPIIKKTIRAFVKKIEREYKEISYLM